MKNKKILIIGNKDDINAAHVLKSLKTKNAEVEILDTTHFPRFWNIDWDINTNKGGVRIDSKTYWSFEEIHSVYMRSIKGISLNLNMPDKMEELYSSNALSSLRVFLQHPGIRFVNKYSAHDSHKIKPHQLRVVKELGVNIPQTLISNNIFKIDEFVNETDACIIKHVYGGEYVDKIKSVDVQKEKIFTEKMEYSVFNSAYTIQQLIPGENIRTFVFDNKTISLKIDAELLDFRISKNQKISIVDIPKEIQEQSVQLTKALGMEWTGIDWRVNNKNEFYFLEANFSPMFYVFEKESGAPLADLLVELLLK